MAKVINFNPGKNVKAGIFEKYMKDNDLNFFQQHVYPAPHPSGCRACRPRP